MNDSPVGIDLAACSRPGGWLGKTFCAAPHPNNPQDATDITAEWAWCRRLKGHAGPHAAFTFLISQPETWPAT